MLDKSAGMLDRVLAQQTRILRSLSPPVRAFGIGGSIGAHQADKLADLDFFVLLPTRNFFKHLNRIREALPGFSTVASLSEPEFHPGFGFQLSYILRDGTSLEYFFNCLETLTDDPMRLKTKVLFDPKGLLTKLLKRSATRHRAQARRLLRRLAFDYLTEILKMRKYAIREEIVPFFPRLVRLRRVLICLDRFAILGEVCSLHDADRRLLSDFGKKYVRGLSQTFALPCETSILHSIHILRRRILNRMHKLGIDRPSVAGGTYFELERTIFHDLELALRNRAKPRLS
jgi:hypothetical protein